MADVEKVFSDSAFDCLDNNIKENLKKLYINMQGKTTEQMIPYIMQFVKTVPKGMILTTEQKNAIIKAVTAHMNDTEKKNLMFILKLFNF